MIEVSFSASFKRAFKKKIKAKPDLEIKFWKKLDLFTQEPFNSGLRTHKLSGKLKDLWSFAVEYDVRVIFYFTDSGNAVLIDIGSHDQVY